MKHPEEALDQPAIPVREHIATIREIHHRLKNHLQMVSTLVGLQASRTSRPELARMLRETRNRIRAISKLYDPLCSVEDFSAIHFGLYLHKWARALEGFYDLGPRVNLQVSADDMAFDTDIAVPLALIVNELLSNAYKHAFCGDRSGAIALTLRYAADPNKETQMGELSVIDDGVGLPAGIDIATAESIGFYLVRTLSQQVGATIEVLTNRGTSIRIRFPLAE